MHFFTHSKTLNAVELLVSQTHRKKLLSLLVYNQKCGICEEENHGLMRLRSWLRLFLQTTLLTGFKGMFLTQQVVTIKFECHVHHICINIYGVLCYV